MAYDKEQIYKQAEEQVKTNNLFYIEDIVAFLPISKTTFYEFYPAESYELNALKSLLKN